MARNVIDEKAKSFRSYVKFSLLAFLFSYLLLCLVIIYNFSWLVLDTFKNPDGANAMALAVVLLFYVFVLGLVSIPYGVFLIIARIAVKYLEPRRFSFMFAGGLMGLLFVLLPCGIYCLLDELEVGTLGLIMLSGYSSVTMVIGLGLGYALSYIPRIQEKRA